MIDLDRDQLVSPESNCKWGEVLDALDAKIAYKLKGIPTTNVTDSHGSILGGIALATAVIARIELAERIYGHLDDILEEESAGN